MEKLKSKKFILIAGGTLSTFLLLFIIFQLWLQSTSPTGFLRERVSFQKIASVKVRQDQGMGPTFVALAPARQKVFVSVPKKDCNSSQQSAQSMIGVINAKTGQLEQALELPQHVLGIAVSPDEKYLYAANSYSDQVSIIDLDSLQIVKTIALGSGEAGDGCNIYQYKPQFFSFSRDGKFVYATNAKGDSLTVIDTQKQELWGFISVVNGKPTPSVFTQREHIPWGIAAHPKKDLLYVSEKLGGRILVIDTVQNKMIGEIKADTTYILAPYGLAVSPGGEYLYAANPPTQSLLIFSTFTQAKVGEISFDINFYPNWITLSKDGRFAFVSGVGTDLVQMVDLSEKSVVGKLESPGNPFMALPDSTLTHLYTSSLKQDSLSIYSIK